MMGMAVATPDADVDARPVSVHLAAMQVATMAIAPASDLLDDRSLSGQVGTRHA
jgi:hypothetical protein